MISYLKKNEWTSKPLLCVFNFLKINLATTTTKILKHLKKEVMDFKTSSLLSKILK